MRLLLCAFVCAAGTVCSVAPAAADCDRCGSKTTTRKVCRVECEAEEVTETCWDCECEDFCVPGPSCLRGVKCEADPCIPCKLRKRLIWAPGCAEIRTRKVLVKREATRKVPSYKWVVEEVCADCRHSRSCGERATEKEAEELASKLGVYGASAPTVEKPPAPTERKPVRGDKAVRYVGFWQSIFGWESGD